MRIVALLSALIMLPQICLAVNPVLKGQTARPLRYQPEGLDFVIHNGRELFNRPLYARNNAFRIDAGDLPEFSFYLPGRGGNLRLGIRAGGRARWLNDLDCTARYRPGSMLYELRDPMLGSGTLSVVAIPMIQADGLIVRAQAAAIPENVELVFAFGGMDGHRGNRGGDIGAERVPVREFFYLKPEYCRENQVELNPRGFTLTGKPARFAGITPPEAKMAIADARQWDSADAFVADTQEEPDFPVVRGSTPLKSDLPVFLGIQRTARPTEANEAEFAAAAGDAELPSLFDQAEANRKSIAEKIVVNTPDPFINAAASALCVAADAVWDKNSGCFMHGAVAWRSKLLGWRGPYAGDALGWHERLKPHLIFWSTQQNTREEYPTQAKANIERNLSCDDYTMLHSNGDMCKKHYDMNLSYIDALIRHLMWTGDRELMRQLWPTYKRHLAWERRNFRREFGEDKLPLYEAYCCIWASDNLQYSGGGVTHASAYNHFHNKMAARIAKELGEDPAPYAHEADDILKAMKRELWLPDRGWFAECKDLLGAQLVHPSAALWTVYHAIDSQVTNDFEAYQLGRYVDTQIPHIPIHGPGVPEGFYTLTSSNWMPYRWSINNVVIAEVAHTSLAQWQANKPVEAFQSFKGVLLDSMFMSLCPGNVAMASQFDCYRGQSQRDFADPIATCSRALVEGLFGIRPDALAGELTIRPGFPAAWESASIKHPDLDFSYRREDWREAYIVESRFEPHMKLKLQIPALRDHVAEVLVNGKTAQWRNIDSAVGRPMIEVSAPQTARMEFSIRWAGEPIEQTPPAETRVDFAQVSQGDLKWWRPIEIVPYPTWRTHTELKVAENARMEMVDLSAILNDRVTQIFKNEYLSPRSPYCSLSIPRQGVGGWCDFAANPEIDDSGLRSLAREHGGQIPTSLGIPFKTTGEESETNIAFVSQWDNYPREISASLNGAANHLYLLMAGSTNHMQSRLDNGEVIVTYEDGTTARLPLRNPEIWWPIEQDYFVDDYGFKIDGPLPPRLDLKTGELRVLKLDTFKGRGGVVPGGAATILHLPLDSAKSLKSLTVRAFANEVVIGLMSATLARD